MVSVFFDGAAGSVQIDIANDVADEAAVWLFDSIDVAGFWIVGKLAFVGLKMEHHGFLGIVQGFFLGIASAEAAWEIRKFHPIGPILIMEHRWINESH